ncbi:MAG TPA: FGGY-family carbohydrate kinase, partial [Geminicoccaceae bacterium]|nr:FGGY-family carbohydrate kinase [Geminicoccaceae bacterium]
ILSAGGSLRWYRDVIASAEVADAQARGVDPYDALMAAAADVAPGADGLFFLPYLAGERTPHMDPFARGGWVGLTLAHDRPHLLRALLEGVSFALKDALVLMRRLGVSPDVLYAVGGGARNALWRGMLASVLGVPLQRVAVEEGPALGAALLAAVGAGVHADVAAAVAAAVRTQGSPDAPDAALQPRYNQLHSEFTALYPALRQTRVWHPDGSGR